jgi:non-specific serine/threonine protein kinase
MVGRDRELAEMRELLGQDDVRLLTLTGAGGVGKTRLALALAHELAPTFPGGAAFVPLAPLADSALVLPAIAAAIGLREGGDHTCRDALVAFLEGREPLLILDNCEHVLNAAPEVVDLISSVPRLRVLATSRNLLRVVGEYAIAVPPLPVPASTEVPDLDSAAVQLFVDRARAVRADLPLDQAHLGVIAEIVRRLDGLPLAIELAAARSNVLSPQALLVRLERRLVILTGGPRNLPTRHQTLRGAISWSHDLLSPDEQNLFRRLAIFAGGFTIEAAEAVTSSSDADVPRVLDGIAALVDASLVVQREQPDGTTRFAMLETVREYALEQLAVHGDDRAVAERLARWCLQLANSSEPAMTTPTATIWLARLALERDNIRTALAWAIDSGEARTAQALAGAYFWMWLRRYPHEGRIWLERALTVSGGDASEERARALYALGALAFWVDGDATRGIPLIAESLAIYRALGHRRGTVEGLFNLSHLSWATGDHNRALALANEGEPLAIAIGAEDVATLFLVNRALVARDQGDLARARQGFESALAQLRRLGFMWSTGWILLHMADLARQQGDATTAVAAYAEGAAVWHADGDAWATVVALRGAALAVQEARQFEGAARLLGATEALGQAAGLPVPLPWRADRERAISSARLAMGDAPFAAAWAEGRHMGTDEAIAGAVALSAPAGDRTGSRAAGPSLPGGLSEREAEVLRLAATGLSNADIADRLFLSPHTVRAHLHHIYGKLEIGTRAEAVRYALEHGLG